MKSGAGILFFVLIIILLVAALAVTKRQARNLHAQSTMAMIDLSNQLAITAVTLNDLRQVGQLMTNDLAAASQRFERNSNDLVEMSGRLTSATGEFEAEQGLANKLGRRVGDLLPKNRNLNECANVFSNDFILLSDQLLALQQQLQISQSNELFLAAGLHEQMEQKSELQRRFNDLDEVSARFNYLAYGFY